MTKAEVVAAIRAEIDSASQWAERSGGHELANASWCIHGLEIALQIVEQWREDEVIAEGQQRERFEAWLRSLDWDDEDLKRHSARGDYMRSYTAARWNSWKAALTWKATT